MSDRLKESEILSELFKDSVTKAHRTQLDIVKAAIRNYVRIGFEKTTFEKVAQTAKVSRPLIQHYFTDREDLFDMTIRYIRAILKNSAVSAMKKGSGPEGILECYIRACFTWAKDYPSHAKVWLLYFYMCSIHKSHRNVHSLLTTAGAERISGLIEEGIRLKVFAEGQTLEKAKAIQSFITGGTVMILSENLPLPAKSIEDEVVKACINSLK